MNERFIIKGGRPLKGEVEVRGSKNVASKLMIASLLTEKPCVIENVPLSQETEITRELCESIGSRVEFGENSLLKIETPHIKTSRIAGLSRRNRIPILALAPLLHRKGVAEVPVLGGCPIGHRPINFHIEALSLMGAKIERRENSYYAEAPELHGAEIEFPYPSVGATENIILAASLARGRTFIKNAAMEPEILNLIQMLQQMGAKISFDIKSRAIEIEGVKNLQGVRVRVIPDRNEIASFASAALATDGEIFIKDVQEDYLTSFLQKINEIGANFKSESGGIKFWGRRPYRAVSITTAPHPNFMTDWQQPFAVLLTQASGESIIHETVYEDRFEYVKDLNKMGAQVEVSKDCPVEDPCRFLGLGFGHTAKISGFADLRGAEIAMTDIRAGMAHIIAALVAEGESVISGVEHVDRGYEKIDERLRALGADITRIH